VSSISETLVQSAKQLINCIVGNLDFYWLACFYQIMEEGSCKAIRKSFFAVFK